MIKSKTNPGLDLVGSGEAHVELLQYEFSKGLLDVLEYLRSEVLMVTRIPKMWVGLSDGSNRSTAEASLIPLETRVKKIQQIVSSYINKSLMPKLGYSNLGFKFNPMSLMEEKSILQNAQVLSTLNLDAKSEHPVITYLKNKGFALPHDVEFVQIQSNNQIQMDSAPSRQRMNQKTDTINSNLDKKGVSDEGRIKMEKEQLAKVV